MISMIANNQNNNIFTQEIESLRSEVSSLREGSLKLHQVVTLLLDRVKRYEEKIDVVDQSAAFIQKILKASA